MKKILFIIFGLLLIGVVLFFVFGGRETITNLLNNENQFGTFFDINTPSANNFDQTPTSTSTPVINPDEKYVAPILRQISFEPVSGYTFYTTTTTEILTKLDENNLEISEQVTSTSTVIRFQERATGHIYDVFEFIFAPQLISNITIPRIYETLFTINKDQFVYKTLGSNNEQIISKRGILTFSTSTDETNNSIKTETELNTLDLSNIIKNMIYNISSNQLIYSVEQNNTSTIFTSNIDRTNEKFIKNLPFNEFILSTINPNEVLITTKASRDTLGYAYILNTSTGSFSKVIGDIRGLLVNISKDKEWVIYSESTQSRPITRLFNTINGSTSQIVIDTLSSEKCVFAQTDSFKAYCFGALIYTSATYPDDWYKGKVKNIEELYEINLSSGEVFPIFYFDDEENNVIRDFDVMNVSITPNDSHLIFQNKHDLTLWTIDLNKMNESIF
jgi:hypothetical protein